MKRVIALVAACSLFSYKPASATLYRHITAETVSPYYATINPDGSLTEDGVNYPAVFKPVPQATWVRSPWISPSQMFRGYHAIGMEIDPQNPTTSSDVDKVNLTLSSGNDPFALTFGQKRYTGFALKLPSTGFQIPTGSLLIAQWWQGAPYVPPVSLHITGDTTNVVSWELWTFNNDTLGNPSSTPIVVGSGTIPFDQWTSIVVMIIPDYTGSGQIKMWQNGTAVVNWTGKVGYDPSTIPYNGAPPGTSTPNQNFNVYFGPYRARQNTKQQMFFDEIKFSDTYAEAVP
jgi:hypothetical protein